MNGNFYDYQTLKTVREAKYGRDEFADKLGVTVMTVSRMERGKATSYDVLLKACQTLGIDSHRILYSSRKVSLSC